MNGIHEVVGSIPIGSTSLLTFLPIFVFFSASGGAAYPWAAYPLGTLLAAVEGLRNGRSGGASATA